MTITKLLAAAALAAPLAGLGLPTAPAVAMPMADPALARTAPGSPGIETVRWVCGPFGCVWRHRPLYRPYPVYGYGFGPAYGYHRPWRGHWGGYGPGWHRRHWHHGW